MPTCVLITEKCSCTGAGDHLGRVGVLSTLEAYIWMSLGRGGVIKAWRTRSGVGNPEIIPRNQGK